MVDKTDRPTPEEFLKIIEAEKTFESRPQLKIFLGMAAGVGKTYAMLSEAQELKREGVNVIIGIVETHGRQETAALVHDMTIVSPKIIPYRGIDFKELDVEAVISLKPDCVLIDELAHSNIPGSRHEKRWQDVLEILDAGIHVYTTLNVQHIESLNDVVQGITDTSIRETVPDSIIEKASSIHLVDLSPEDLLVRLKEGKVYLGNQSRIAVQNFFQKDILTALRELVLRYAADKVDSDLRQMAPKDERITEWKPREKFLVGISSSPFSQKLIRITRRLAFNIDAPWVAVHVNVGTPLSEKETQSLEKNLSMARDLGAEVMTVNDPDVASGLQRVANQRGVTQMIIGLRPASPYFGFVKCSSAFDKLIQECPNIDIHVIKHETDDSVASKKYFDFSFGDSFSPYFWILTWTALISLCNWVFFSSFNYKSVGSLFLLDILGLSLFFKKGPIFLASSLFAAIWLFFFVPPINHFWAVSNEDILLLTLYLSAGILSGILIDRAREHREMLIKSEETSQTLYEIVNQIANSPSPEETVKFLKTRLDKKIPGNFDFILKDIDDGIDVNHHPLLSDTKEKNSALWAFENGKEAGWSTDTLPSAHHLYIPLQSFNETLGLLIFTPIANKKIPSDDKSFLYTVCQQLANFIERRFSQEKAQEHEHLLRLEGIQKEIFEQFIEAFQYPITKIDDSIRSFKERFLEPPNEIRAIDSSCELIRQILNNMMAIIQINEGILPLKKSSCDITSLIQECYETLQIPSLEHPLSLSIAPQLPLIPCDEYLIEILVCNLILHAAKHSPTGSKIDIVAKKDNHFFIFSVTSLTHEITELATGQAEDESDRLSLGLSISKTIAEIHEGRLVTEKQFPLFETNTLYLPLKK